MGSEDAGCIGLFLYRYCKNPPRKKPLHYNKSCFLSVCRRCYRLKQFIFIHVSFQSWTIGSMLLLCPYIVNLGYFVKVGATIILICCNSKGRTYEVHVLTIDIMGKAGKSFITQFKIQNIIRNYTLKKDYPADIISLFAILRIN